MFLSIQNGTFSVSCNSYVFFCSIFQAEKLPLMSKRLKKPINKKLPEALSLVRSHVQNVENSALLEVNGKSCLMFKIQWTHAMLLRKTSYDFFLTALSEDPLWMVVNGHCHYKPLFDQAPDLLSIVRHIAQVIQETNEKIGRAHV